MRNIISMPNHCWNILTIVGHKEDLDEFKKHKLSFQHFNPIPEHLTDAEKYEWMLDNWGTKWDNYEFEILGDDTRESYNHNVLECRFITAWSPPIRFLENLVKQFPRCWLKLFWKTEHDTGGVFVHYYKNQDPAHPKTVVTNWNEAIPFLTANGKIYVPDDDSDTD
jgi:hypothetical protein